MCVALVVAGVGRLLDAITRFRFGAAEIDRLYWNTPYFLLPADDSGFLTEDMPAQIPSPSLTSWCGQSKAVLPALQAGVSSAG